MALPCAQAKLVIVQVRTNRGEAALLWQENPRIQTNRETRGKSTRRSCSLWRKARPCRRGREQAKQPKSGRRFAAQNPPYSKARYFFSSRFGALSASRRKGSPNSREQ